MQVTAPKTILTAGPSITQKEIDNVVRGVGSDAVWPGAMTYATLAMASWAYHFLKVDRLLLRLFSDNARALALCDRCGFTEVGRVPVRKTVDGDITTWVEAPDMPLRQARRYFLTMYLPKATLERLYPSDMSSYPEGAASSI